MPVLATWAPADALMDAVVPLGLAVAAGTALVVDLDANGPALGGAHSLADLVARGPTAAELAPRKVGAAVLANGGVDAATSAGVVAALAERWPALVLRCPPGGPRPDGAITFLPLLPEPFTLVGDGVVVYQRCGVSPHARPSGRVLPQPRRSTVHALLSMGRPPRRDRWLGALAQLWVAA